MSETSTLIGYSGRTIGREYAVSPDGMKMFGVLDLATEMAGCRTHSPWHIASTALSSSRSTAISVPLHITAQRPSSLSPRQQWAARQLESQCHL
jgi:hypothetical protein